LEQLPPAAFTDVTCSVCMALLPEAIEPADVLPAPPAVLPPAVAPVPDVPVELAPVELFATVPVTSTRWPTYC
jgi:hypothetical protein